MSSVEWISQLIDGYTALRGRWGVAVDIGAALLATIGVDPVPRVLFDWLYRRAGRTSNIWDDAVPIRSEDAALIPEIVQQVRQYTRGPDSPTEQGQG